MAVLQDGRHIVLCGGGSGCRLQSLFAQIVRYLIQSKKAHWCQVGLLRYIPDLRLFTPLPGGVTLVGCAVEDIAEALTNLLGPTDWRLHYLYSIDIFGEVA